MKVTLESTTKIVDLVIDGKTVPARVWQGTTEGGVRCHAFITRIAVHEDDDPEEFNRELIEKAQPRPEIDAIPLRMIV